MNESFGNYENKKIFSEKITPQALYDLSCNLFLDNLKNESNNRRPEEIKTIEIEEQTFECFEYKVKSGDTLFSIANEFIDEGVGEIVDLIIMVNKLKSSSISPNKKIYIPLYLLPSAEIERRFLIGNEVEFKPLKGFGIDAIYKHFGSLPPYNQEVFRKINNLSSSEKVNKDKKYKVPGVYKIKLKGTLWSTLESYTFDPRHYKKILKDNQNLNTEFENVSSEEDIPKGTTIYVNKKYFFDSSESVQDEVIIKPKKTTKTSTSGIYTSPEKIPGIKKSFYIFENGIEVVSQEFKDLSIVLDAGHGGNNARIHINGIHEHEVVYDISNRLFVLLKQHGADVHTTVISPKGPHVHKKTTMKSDKNEVYYGTKTKVLAYPKDINKRGKLANKLLNQSKKRQMFLSIHTNAGRKSAYGMEVHVYKKERRTGDLFFAENIIDASRNIESYNRGLKLTGKGVLANKSTKKVTKINCDNKVLVELGFHTNENDAKKLADPEWRQEYAEMLFDGICRTHLRISSAEMKRKNNLENKNKLSQTEFLEKTTTLTLEERGRAKTLDSTYKANREESTPISEEAMGEMLVIYAKAVEEHYGVPAEVALMQTVLESAWGIGTANRKLPRTHLNLHGIKDPNGKEYTSNEGVNANESKVSKFGNYNNIWESFSAYGSRLKNKKYKNAKTTVYSEAFKAKTPRDFIKKLAPIYAEDKNYTEKCIDTWTSIAKKWPNLTKEMSLDRKL